MSKNNVVEFSRREEMIDPLAEVLRSGAQQLLQQAIGYEVQDLLATYSDSKTVESNAAVVQNGFLPERPIQTDIGPVPIQVPKVCSRTGEPVTFRSALVPPYVRKTKLLEAALPWLYLKGVSSGEVSAALKVLVVSDAEGLSSSAVSRLKQQWSQEYEIWHKRRLDNDHWVYI